MSTSSRSVIAPVLLLAMVARSYATAPGEQILLDPSTGNYVVSYCGIGPVGAKQTCDLKTVTFVPATKINPKTKVRLELRAEWTVAYNYQVLNAKASKQSIILFAVRDAVDPVGSSANGSNHDDAATTAASLMGLAASALRTPAAWEPFVSGATSGTSTFRIAWIYSDLDSAQSGLPPGFALRGFAVMSKALPGITAAEHSGNSGEPLSFEDEGPSGDIAAQLNQLTLSDFVARDTAGPKVEVPDPYDPAVLIKRISGEMNKWVTLNEIDAAVAQQVDAFLQAMASAASHEDWASVRKQIHALERFIKDLRRTDGNDDDGDVDSSGDEARTSQTTLSGLAAQVLRFDLQYVASRLGGHDDQEKDR